LDKLPATFGFFEQNTSVKKNQSGLSIPQIGNKTTSSIELPSVSK
jgi:hypothetical protein